MLVRERMISPGKRLSANLPITSAIGEFEKVSSSWLPVVDDGGTLVGLLTWSDVRKAQSMLSAGKKDSKDELLVQDFMTTRFLFVTEKTPIEEAVRIMIDYDIPELPVVKDGYFSGIISDKTMLRVLMEITGARRQGVRLMVKLENKSGKLLELLQMIRDLGGSIEGLCTYSGQENEYSIATMRVEDADKYSLKQGLNNLNLEVLDIR